MKPKTAALLFGTVFLTAYGGMTLYQRANPAGTTAELALCTRYADTGGGVTGTRLAEGVVCGLAGTEAGWVIGGPGPLMADGQAVVDVPDPSGARIETICRGRPHAAWPWRQRWARLPSGTLCLIPDAGAGLPA